MRVYLVKGKRLVLQVKGKDFLFTPWEAKTSIDLSPHDIQPCNDKIYSVLHNKLKSHLETPGKQELQVSFHRGMFKDTDLTVNIEGNILGDLSLILGTEFDINAQLSNFQVCPNKSLTNLTNGISKRRQSSIISTSSRPASTVELRKHLSEDKAFRGGITMPIAWSSKWPTRGNANQASIIDKMKKFTFTVKFDIIIGVSNSNAQRMLLPEDSVRMNRRLLEEQFQADMEIVASNGTIVKCHRLFLAANSDVIKAMMESNFAESETMKIEMNDISEEAVKALLEYIYCRNLAMAEGKCSVAVELLKAAEKYMIKPLEYGVKCILLEQPISWLDVDASLMLYLFVVNVDRHRDLQSVAVKSLKLKRQQLLQSPLYKQLMEENPTVGERILRLK